MKLCAVKRVGRRLSDPDVFGPDHEPRIELPALGAASKRPCVFLMLDQNHRNASGSRLCGEVIDSLDDPFDVECGRVAGAQGALDVDDEECRLHAEPTRARFGLADA
jgi:hypothetical protein